MRWLSSLLPGQQTLLSSNNVFVWCLYCILFCFSPICEGTWNRQRGCAICKAMCCAHQPISLSHSFSPGCAPKKTKKKKNNKGNNASKSIPCRTLWTAFKIGGSKALLMPSHLAPRTGQGMSSRLRRCTDLADNCPHSSEFTTIRLCIANQQNTSG